MKKAVIIVSIAAFAAAICFSVIAATTNTAEMYSGLIVDARELGVEPGKSPKVFDQNGIEIYGTVNIDPDIVIEKGIVQYSRTIGDAIRDSLAGGNPIVVRAIDRGPHPYKADVMVSTKDALWILKANRKSGFLQDLKVVFVI